ncbi:MAG TPA: hypothetical protein VFO66_14865 [Gemmatimonadaceae bacterium]|nr:hypothetical protein [Gemmatimonadaceae bacterium]
MPLKIAAGAPTLLIRRAALERAGLSRAQLDERLNLTADEFRLERDLIVVGPIHGEDIASLVAELEEAGLAYFDDFFELTGNWPEWMTVFAGG